MGQFIELLENWGIFTRLLRFLKLDFIKPAIVYYQLPPSFNINVAIKVVLEDCYEPQEPVISALCPFKSSSVTTDGSAD